MAGQCVRSFTLVKKKFMQSFRFLIFKGSTLLAFVNKKGKRQNEILPDQELLIND